MQPLADHPDHQITLATALVRDQSHDAQIAQDSIQHRRDMPLRP
ncbi:MAG: hypothetical protein ABSG43_16825 [Solirubrobacteraceae bacterium]|jgi:hypothetical protein